ncbi:MAG: iron-sulfur cluster repair di-iron protein [Bryobacterales bacterium]|nr:iron-sulfur cluster repair di-iron protein [Bryobacterales bacterium]
MTVLDSSTTIAELAAGSLAAVSFFERNGIDYCCGGKRALAEVCEEKGLDFEKVGHELQAALAAGNGSGRDWNHAPLSEIVDHIVNTHHNYLRREMPTIAARLEKVYRVYNQRYGETFPGLPEVYAALQEELLSHVENEEEDLFPAIKAYEKAALAGEPLPPSPLGSGPNPIQALIAEHEEAGVALSKIREITGDYAIPDYACVTYRALIAGFKEMEQDIHMHIHLENNILFPRVSEIAAKRN